MSIDKSGAVGGAKLHAGLPAVDSSLALGLGEPAGLGDPIGNGLGLDSGATASLLGGDDGAGSLTGAPSLAGAGGLTVNPAKPITVSFLPPSARTDSGDGPLAVSAPPQTAILIEDFGGSRDPGPASVDSLARGGHGGGGPGGGAPERLHARDRSAPRQGRYLLGADRRGKSAGAGGDKPNRQQSRRRCRVRQRVQLGI